MGQLEKYGLYVLCLVIFLILGVTIWGGGDLPPTGRRAGASPSADLHASSSGGGAANAKVAPSSGNVLGGIADLIKPPVKKTEPKNESLGTLINADSKKGDGKPVEGGPGPSGPGSSGPGTSGPGSGEQPVVLEPVGPRPTHKVASGETFEGIAKALFGSAAVRSEIARLNPGVEPTRMRIGQELKLPTKAEADKFLGVASAKGAVGKSVVVPALAGNSTYSVVKGDTLEGIASRQLGSRSRLEDLLKANPGVDPARLKIGQKLQLPKK
jgi:LysM repeat protein